MLHFFFNLDCRTFRKRQQEEQTEKKKWSKPKSAKKAKLAAAAAAQEKQFDTGLDLALDEELALHLLGSKH